jgi:hypothetical protein
MSSIVPNPQIEFSNPNERKPAPTDSNMNVEVSSSTSKIFPFHVENTEDDEDAGSTSKKSLTLAEEFLHFRKTTKTSSEEEIMAFIIPAIIRRDRAGLQFNDPMPPLVTETKTEELPAEFAAFRGLLRQVVKVERKPAPSDKP